jgi:DNA repair protein RadC
MSKHLLKELNPNYRLGYAGPAALSTKELLQVVIGGKASEAVAQQLIESCQNEGLGRLLYTSNAELEQLYQIGPITASRIRAAFELGRRTLLSVPMDSLQIRSPADVANTLMIEMGLLEREELRVVLLDSKNKVKRIDTIYQGSLNTAVVRIGEVFAPAIRINAAAIIVVHNHPSGDPTPSPEDVRVTQKIVDAGELMNIDVLDHLVIGRNRYVSMKERGLGF